MEDYKNRNVRSETVLSRFSAAEREALEKDPEAFEALNTLSAYSPALTQILAAREDLLHWLFLEKSFARPARPEDMAAELASALPPVPELSELQKVLRLYRLKEMARLTVRDLTGRADLTEVMTTLSSLADACLELALATAMELTATRYGLPPDRLGFRPVILGMGKLGGRELNFSSDVDLIYLYQPGKRTADGPGIETTAHAVFTTVTRAISEVTADGFVFRVDLDLRPGGKDGAQAQSLEAARKHYLILGQPWERMALLKARPVAGDLESGAGLLEELIPFVYRRYLDYSSLEELKGLKLRFTREKKGSYEPQVQGTQA